MELVLGLLAGLAADDARCTLLGDSSGFPMVKHGDREDARRGIVPRLESNKLHMPAAPHGRIVACAVTAGRRRDSPAFRETYGRIPRGAATLCWAPRTSAGHCTMIACSGRSPAVTSAAKSGGRKRTRRERKHPSSMRHADWRVVKAPLPRPEPHDVP